MEFSPGTSMVNYIDSTDPLVYLLMVVKSGIVRTSYIATMVLQL